MNTPAIGGRWEARRLLALLTTVALAAALTVMYSDSARADHQPPDDVVAHDGPGGTNEAPFWVNYLEENRGISGATCTKLEDASSSAFVMPAAPVGQVWVLLVVKQATSNFVYFDPEAGHTYPSTGDQAPGYSHIIYCSVDEPPPTTTTTVEDTTTTTVEDTTTTTVEDTTTTTVEDTTTTTVEDEVLPTVITTTTIAGTDLPLTGARTDALLGLAVVLFGLGLATLTMTRRLETE
jgi:hypothetical protein